MKDWTEILVSQDWLNTHPRVVVLNELHLALDHCSLLLDTDRVSHGRPKPFSFEQFWLKIEGAKKIIEDIWMKPSKESIILKLFYKFE